MKKSDARDRVPGKAAVRDLLVKIENADFDSDTLIRYAGILRTWFDANERKYQELIRLLRAMGRLGVFIKNYETGLAIPNGLWTSLGYSPDDMRGETWRSAVHPDDIAEVDRNLEEMFEGEQDITQAAYRIRGKDSDYKWILSKSVVVSRTKAGKPAWFLGADFDITLRVQSEERARLARVEAEQKALEAETLLTAAAIIASTLDWELAVQRVLDQAALVVPNDVTLVVLMLDDTVRIVGGRRADGLPVDSGDLVQLGGPNPYTWIAEERLPLSVNDMPSAYPDHSMIAGVTIRSWLGVPLVAANTLLGALVVARSDAGHYNSEHIRLAAAFAEHVSIVLHNAREFREVRRQATTDLLTEALTRRAFLEEARNELSRCQAREEPFAVIMIDLDHFKNVNDDCGHEAGDQVLSTVSRYWKSELRDGDLFGRLGGEEFAVALPGATDAVAARIAERLRKRSTEVIVPCNSRHITASFGVASDLADGGEIADIVRRSDRNLYVAKSRGRNQVVTDQNKDHSDVP
ncbi:MAG TPA: diguanylate cyclase [Spirochaetia bacterium]|nr:diguanylate cyclase [Spirochaetia bacterium]